MQTVATVQYESMNEVSIHELKPRLSVVIPVLNQAEVVEEIIRRVNDVLKHNVLTYEMIVVDDGSTDDTGIRLKACSEVSDHLKVVTYHQNRGKGYALKTGFNKAKGSVVVFIDGDLDVNVGQIVCYVKALEYGDVVIASKWHPQSKVEMPLTRKILSYGFNTLVRLLTGIRLRDTQTGLKAVRRKSLQKVFSRLVVKRYAFDVELLAVASLLGLKVVELPVTLKIKRGLFSPKDIWRMLVDLLGITYRLRVKRFYHDSTLKSYNNKPSVV